MSSVETEINCPHCGEMALTKWDKSHHGTMYDACPNCMYLYHRNSKTPGYEGRVALWQSILKCHGKTLSELRDWVNTLQPDQYFRNSFTYPEDRAQHCTRLGGDRLFTNDPKYRERYLEDRPSTKYIQLLKRQNSPKFFEWLQNQPVLDFTLDNDLDWL